MRIRFQGEYPPARERGPWRDFVSAAAGPSINLDRATRFRFMLIFDRSAGSDAVVEELRVFYRD